MIHYLVNQILETSIRIKLKLQQEHDVNCTFEKNTAQTSSNVARRTAIWQSCRTSYFTEQPKDEISAQSYSKITSATVIIASLKTNVVCNFETISSKQRTSVHKIRRTFRFQNANQRENICSKLIHNHIRNSNNPFPKRNISCNFESSTVQKKTSPKTNDTVYISKIRMK